MHSDPSRLAAPCAAGAAWLERNTRLPEANRHSLLRMLPVLVDRIPRGRKVTVGISGPPGTGKSTLAGLLAHVLDNAGDPVCVLSLDDYYLGRAQREKLARDIHPLFAQRGVPGTHELDRLTSDLARLMSGDIRELRLPVFDKSKDDRAPIEAWTRVRRAPRVVLLEGWFIGAPRPDFHRPKRAINDTERRRDPKRVWRRALYRFWDRYHRSLEPILARRWYLRAPDWQSVVAWRWAQERELSAPHLRSREEVARFLDCFERIVRHMQQSARRWADLVLQADRDHCLRPLAGFHGSTAARKRE